MESRLIFDTETLLKLQDRNLRFQNLWILQKIITTLELNFFKFLAFFQSVLVVSYLVIQQRKTRWITEVF